MLQILPVGEHRPAGGNSFFYAIAPCLASFLYLAEIIDKSCHAWWAVNALRFLAVLVLLMTKGERWGGADGEPPIARVCTRNGWQSPSNDAECARLHSRNKTRVDNLVI